MVSTDGCPYHMFILKTKYSRLSSSRSPWDFQKYFEVCVPRHIRFAELRKNNHISQWICNLTHEVRDVLKILWKRGKIAPMEQLHLFSTIFCYLLLDFHVQTGSRFSLRDKLLFEISEVEITRVDFICKKHLFEERLHSSSRKVNLFWIILVR